jgi:hypothetical protein
MGNVSLGVTILSRSGKEGDLVYMFSPRNKASFLRETAGVLYLEIKSFIENG